MTLADSVTQRIILKLLKGQDYRIEVITLIQAVFLQYTIDFFKRVVEVKLNNQSITPDWYKTEFLNPNLPANQLIINAGLNRKTITNMYNSAKREIILDVTIKHYDLSYEAINDLVEHEKNIDLILTIKLRGVSVDLNINESLIVNNTLAVKRAEIRGGAWSTTGKRVEGPLMLTLCKLFQVPEECYEFKGLTEIGREVDFYLITKDKKKYHCEVKLMGRGNPESADVIFARETKVFIADKLSKLNKEQLTNEGVHWIELHSKNGYEKFTDVLRALDIPYRDLQDDIEQRLNVIFNEMFQ
jgi:hypothetical protein